MPLISNYTIAVILPNWNGGKYLAEMLDSLISQTFEDFKVFVVDDESTDNSIEILKKYTMKDSRIHYVVRNRQTKGAQTCRNIGFERSIGAKYVVFFDNDDLVAPFCLEQRIAFMDEHQDIDYGIFPALNFEKQPYDNPKMVWGCHYIDDTLKAMLNWTLPMVGWTNIYRRTSYVEKGLYWDERLKSMQDTDFNIQSILKGCKFDYSFEAKPDYFYRNSQGSVSSKIYSKEHAESNVYLVRKIIESMNAAQLEKYDLDIRSYYLKFMEIIFQNKKQVNRLMDLDWIKQKKWFNFKLKLWMLFGCKCRILNEFFKTEFAYFKQNQNNWRKFTASKAYLFFIQKNHNEMPMN